MISKVRYISFDFHHKIKALMNIIFEWIGISIIAIHIYSNKNYLLLVLVLILYQYSTSNFYSEHLCLLNYRLLVSK